jgi:hypothetical protein
MIYKTWIYETPAHELQRGYFEAEVEGVYIRTNCPELQNQPVMFCHDTRAGVIAQIIQHLKAAGFSGKLRIVN